MIALNVKYNNVYKNNSAKLYKSENYVIFKLSPGAYPIGDSPPNP